MKKMAFQVSPGVNVSEIDLTTVVPAVSTTTGALAGHFKWGPVDQRVLISSEDNLVTVFNKPNANTADDFFTAANFLAYGNSLFVSRAVTSANNATTGGTGAYISNEDYYNETYSHSSGHGDWVAKYPGDIGNSLKVSVCHNANAWQSSVATNYYATNNSKIVTLAGDGQGTSNTETQFIVGDRILLGPDKEARRVSALSGNTITLSTAYGGNTVSNYAPSLTRQWEFYANFDRAPTTTTFANTVNAQGDALHVAIIDEDGVITGQSGSLIETYENVSMAPDAKDEQGASLYYKDVVNQQSSWVWWGNHNSNASKAGTNAGLGTNYPGNDLPVTNSMTKGKDGSASDAAYITAYNKFKDADTVDISLVLGSGSSSTVSTHIINNIAEHRKDCVAVISPERADVVNNNGYEGKEADDIIAFRDGLPSSSYAVMDSGWKYQYDKYNDVYRYVPLNGDTAGLMVQTDLTRDPWFSPAGFNRGNVKNVIKLAFNPSKADRDELYKKGINPVVTFPGQGTVLFGDKTMLAQPSAFDRINVRRLFIVLEKAISTASKFTLFEFNDEFTRSQFKNLVEPFLRDVQGRRGITDFQVVCDGTNNTGQVIDNNEFVGDIYVKPARSINFIQLNFVAVRTGVEFSEIVGRAT
jgi:phage tail sheath protein FI